MRGILRKIAHYKIIYILTTNRTRCVKTTNWCHKVHLKTKATPFIPNTGRISQSKPLIMVVPAQINHELTITCHLSSLTTKPRWWQLHSAQHVVSIVDMHYATRSGIFRNTVYWEDTLLICSYPVTSLVSSQWVFTCCLYSFHFQQRHGHGPVACSVSAMS